ncbi:MAG TPA: excinuclease ABC subunit UvrC [bacterium]|nr:excinuclease ABC subunit UvrC [bacterium]
MEKQIKNKLKKIPDCPGVYIMKNKNGEIIYVGKAVCLSKRIKSYFNSSGNNTKVLVLSEQINDFEVIPVASEAEALILENQLIKKYQPKYNINLKDGKSYPLLKITNEKFPSVYMVREKRDNNSTYLGPFTNTKLLKDTVMFIRKFYPLRNCKKNIYSGKTKLCTQFYIGLCSGPCENKISKEEYEKILEGFISFFKGEYKKFEKKLKMWMDEAIKKLDFEQAEKLKQRIFLLEKIKEKFPLRDEQALLSYGDENTHFSLSKILGLKKIPYCIEGYDISNISGQLAVGSKVSFKGGIPDRSEYRKFKIKMVEGIDDYKMLQEIIERRFNSEEERKHLPDLILIDGGKGQLNMVAEKLKEIKIDVPVISIAKKFEEIYTLNKNHPIKLPDDSPELNLLKEIRNEAHRFAVSYHRKLRNRNFKASFLDEISGVGEKTKKKLIKHFQNLSELKNTKIETLKKLGIREKVATEILKKYQSMEVNSPQGR